MNPRVRSRVWFVLRVAVSLALLLWLVTRLRGELPQLGELRLITLWPAAVVFALSSVLGAYQWTLLMRHAGVSVSPRRLQATYWVGLFFNNFLPTNVGGDLVKVTDVALETGTLARPVAATLLDRLMGLSALVTLALVAAVTLGGPTPAGVPWWMLLVVALPVLGGTAAILSRRAGHWGADLADRLTRGRARGRLRALVDEMVGFRVDPAFVARVFLLALLVQSLRVATHLLVAWKLGISLGFLRMQELFVLVPALGVAIVLPISFNGLGLREWVATRLLPNIGIGAGEAFVMELATFLVQVAVSLVGGLIFAWKMLRGRRGGKVRTNSEPTA